MINVDLVIGVLIGLAIVLVPLLIIYIFGERYREISVPGPYDDDFWRLPKSEQKRHYIGNQTVRVYASWWEFFLRKSVFNKEHAND